MNEHPQAIIRSVAEILRQPAGSHFSSNDSLRDHLRVDRDFASLHFWTLQQQGRDAILQAELDSGCEPVVTQKIGYTDFPFPPNDKFMLYCARDSDSDLHKLFLPSEY